MTDIHDMRERLRESRGHQSVVSSSGRGFRMPFGLFAVVAVALGFAVVTFTPKIYSVQRTATLPAFKGAQERVENPGRAAAMAPATPVPDPTKYAGKSADEMGKIADGVCFQRAHAQVPHWSKTPRLTTKELADFDDAESIKHFSVLLDCLVTEAPQRYCSRGQSTMIKAEIVQYFRGIAHANASVAMVKGLVAGTDRSNLEDPDSPYYKLQSLKFKPDERVMAGVEGLIRAGYLGAGERDDIGRAVPAYIRDRLARVVGSKSPCPAPPWWAIWKR